MRDRWKRGWSPVAVAVTLGLAPLLLGACTGEPHPDVQLLANGVASAELGRVRQALHDLSADSMEGRATASRGEERAAHWIAQRFAELGVEAAGDSGYVQRVPLRRVVRPVGRSSLAGLPSWDAYRELPPEARAVGRNLIGIIPGSDPRLRGEAIIVGAHYDHLGIGPAVRGDSIYNGADDDASGVVAVLEIARALRQRAPGRTVVLFLATGEEIGMLGTHWYLEHPVLPLDSTVAALFFEMIGRPDPLAGGPGAAWLTGFERSTMGASFVRAGVHIVPDPRPEQNFFERSDNTPFARIGIPAHVLSSYDLHDDYHTPQDEADGIDFIHLTRVIDTGIEAVRILSTGPPPEWNPGGRPSMLSGEAAPAAPPS